MKTEGTTGSRELVVQVRAALVARDTTLNRWCLDHNVNRSWAYEALMGRRNGQRAQALRDALACGDFDISL